MKQRIAVLGAGPMGLAVAYQLAQDGHEPVVFEADDRVGGMTATFDFNGLEIERYYHFHCISDHAFLTMLDELNIGHKMHWVETKMGYWYQNRLQAWGNPLALLSFKGLGWVAKFRYGLHAFLSTKRDNWKPLVPVIASNVSSLPEVVGDAGILIDPHDVHSLAEHMRELLADDALSVRLGCAARLRSQQFTWRQCADETMQVYKAALNRTA